MFYFIVYSKPLFFSLKHMPIVYNMSYDMMLCYKIYDDVYNYNHII